METRRSAAELPEFPEGTEFEEYVSAHFQASGYYVERHIVERLAKEVLELDIIATNYDQCPPRIALVEVKSGEWGFSDLFKVRGWMDYLNLSDGLFIVSGQKDAADLFAQVATRLGIQLVQIPSPNGSKDALSNVLVGAAIEDVDIWAWRFSYWVERKLLERLKQDKKSSPQEKRFAAVDHYHFDVTSSIFFAPSIVERVHTLYTSFQRYPRISAKCGHEIIGDDFDGDHRTVPPDVYSQTYHDRKYTDIHVSTFVEHVARVAILKSAIDYRLYKDAGMETGAEARVQLLGLPFEVPLLELLPSSFKKGLEEISKHEYFRRYPVFWQWFLWVFGGFILKDYEQEEYELLSRKTGIPVSQIPNALQSYEILFPQSGGWFADLSPNSNITVTKLFSVPFMGVGANYRRCLYAESQKFSDLKLGTVYTLKDLIEWNNLTVQVLLE